MRGKGIAVAGSILVDEINTVSRYPGEGELTQITAVSKAVGGCVPNVAVDLKTIAPALPVYALGKIGRDDNADFVKGVLDRSGVNTDRIIRTDEKTSFTQVISVSGGQRTFFTFPGSSADFGVDDIDFDQLDVALFHLGYFLLLDRVDNGDGVEILKRVKEKGIKTSIDLVSENSDRYQCVLPCLPYTDYLIINELEAGRLAGMSPELTNIPAIAQQLIALGVNEKVIIHFSDGSVCADKSGRVSCLGSCCVPPGYIAGTTGAGDAFCAGALFAINQGLSDNDILEYGTVCATMALSAKDATSGLVHIDEAIRRCHEFERSKLCLSI